jgi:hypothetical protein
MKILPAALGALRPYAQFLIYKLVPSANRAGKTDKLPCDIDGNMINAHDNKHWLDADTACNAATQRGDEWGVAFVLSDDDPFFFIDIDNALTDGKWSQCATELCTSFSGAAVEVSQSQTGLHIIGQLSSFPEHSCKNTTYNLECYTSKRFIALTGINATGDAGTNHDAAFNATVVRYFSVSEHANPATWSTAPVAASCPIIDDARLIEKALKTTSAAGVFGSRATFADLWTCNIDVLSGTYPDDVREFDASSADAALAQHLAFWTGGQCDRIERLMRQSALVRDKWDNHKSYMRLTITNAVAKCRTFYNVGANVEILPNSPTPIMRNGGGYQLMPPTQLIEHFKDCVYIADSHRILTAKGSLLKSEQFNAMYGGYNFALDDTDKTTKKAWEAFTESQCINFPKSDTSSFRPDLPEKYIYLEDGMSVVNTYIPIEIPSMEGDVTPFLNHLNKNLPVERDATILLSYLAACVQYKGVKFKWAPLIQGVEGNGKTLYTMCVAHSVGQRYTHMPPAAEIGEKFNSWLFDKILIGVEDIFVPDHKLELLEVLKPMITGETLAKRAMQTDQTMHRVCANFIFNSNHKSAIKKTFNDRRFAVLYTAQQDAADLEKDGMTGDYFPKLYNWLRNQNGFAYVTNYLQNYKILDQFNPAVDAQRAPVTSTTVEAVNASMGAVEQEIMESIEEGKAGFAGGWVSSLALDKLIERMRADRQIPRNRRRELLRSLGYDWHPSLKNGRVNNVIFSENGKPRLFIKQGHIHQNLTSPVEVVKFYLMAQGAGVDHSVSVI